MRCLLLMAAVASLLTGCVAPGESLSLAFPWLAVGAGVAALGAGLWSRRGLRAAMQFGHLGPAARAGTSLRARLSGLLPALRWLAVFSLCIALGRPQLESVDERTVEGIDIFVVLDLSGSMRAIDLDVSEVRSIAQTTGKMPPNRFESAVATITDFVKSRERDRIGMVVFAKQAFLQFPLTLDYSTVVTLLSRLTLETIDGAATAIGNGLGLAVRGLMESTAKSKAIVLVTDGKQLGGNVSPREAAKIAKDNGIQIFAVQVGRDGDAVVAVETPFGMDLRQQSFPTDPTMLKEIAESSGGAFYRAENKAELDRDLGGILDQLDRSQMQDISSVNEREVYHWFLAAALALLIAEALLGGTLIRRFP